MLQDHGIDVCQWSQGLVLSCRLRELCVPRGVGADDKAARENIAATGKAFGEGTEHHVDVRQGIDIQAGADGVVGDHRDVALVCELADRGKVDTAQ